MKKLLTRIDASEYLRETYGISRTVTTLNRLATEGGGPPFRRHGRRVFYEAKEIDAWVKDTLTPNAPSTAEHNQYERQKIKAIVKELFPHHLCFHCYPYASN